MLKHRLRKRQSRWTVRCAGCDSVFWYANFRIAFEMLKRLQNTKPLDGSKCYDRVVHFTRLPNV